MAAAMLVIATIHLMLGAATDQEFVVKSSSNLVVLDVSVIGSDGTPVQGLTQEAFQIAEDGKRQSIKQFSVAEAPVSIGFVIDMSSSMRSKLAGVRKATSTFLELSNPKDEYFLIGFNDHAWVGLPAGKEFAKGDDIRKALLTVRAAGKTALYDGVALALKHVAESRYERRVLVLITDGKDTASALAYAEALQQVRSSPVTIYTLGLFGDEEEENNRGVLKQLARVSGGKFYEPKTEDSVEQDCVSIAREIRARYTIAYTPPPEAKNTVRRIKVDIAHTAVSGKATVRARSEYTLEPATAPK